MPTTRNDLRDEPFKMPSYIGKTILPTLPMTQDAGSFYYIPVKEDISAQENRNTGALASINESIDTASNTTFTCKEIRGRKGMSYDQVRGHGGIDKAELIMARIAKRAFCKNVELKIASSIFASDSPIDVSGDLPGIIENEVAELQDKAPGKVALVISNKWFTAIKKNAEIKDRMKNTGVVVGAGGDARNVTKEQLAAILGVDEVLVGPNDAWYNGLNASLKNRAALVVLPDENMEPQEEVQLGRTIFFAFSEEADDMYTIESFHDDLRDADFVDCKGQVDVKILNNDLVTVFDLSELASGLDISEGTGSGDDEEE